MQRLKTNEFGLRATSRIKTFVFKFISVPAKWIKTSRRHVLNIYSDNNAYICLIFAQPKKYLFLCNRKENKIIQFIN